MAPRRSKSQLQAQLTQHQQLLRSAGLNGTTEKARADLAEAISQGIPLEEFSELVAHLSATTDGGAATPAPTTQNEFHSVESLELSLHHRFFTASCLDERVQVRQELEELVRVYPHRRSNERVVKVLGPVAESPAQPTSTSAGTNDSANLRVVQLRSPGSEGWIRKGIQRPSCMGNPFPVKEDGKQVRTAAEATALFRPWLAEQLADPTSKQSAWIREVQGLLADGKQVELGCCGDPNCHGHAIAEVLATGVAKIGHPTESQSSTEVSAVATPIADPAADEGAGFGTPQETQSSTEDSGARTPLADPAPTTGDRVDWGMARRHLELHGFAADELVVLTFFPPRETGGTAAHRHYLAALPEKHGATSLEAMQRWLDAHPGYSLGFVLGHGDGAKKADITGVSAIPWEDDSEATSREEKADQWRQTDLPQPTYQLDTGGKSVHHWYRLSEPCSVAAYAAAQKLLTRHIKGKLGSTSKVDSSLSDACQVMRLAGGIHPSTGQRTTLLNITGELFTLPQLMKAAGSSPEQLQQEAESGAVFVIPSLAHGLTPPPATDCRPAPKWLNKKTRTAFEAEQEDYDKRQKPEGMHFRDAAERNVALLRAYVADALPWCPERGPAGSGTYDDAFEIYSCAVNGLGPDIAAELAEQVGWSVGRPDFDLKQKATSIASNPSEQPLTLRRLFDCAEFNGWPRPWPLDIRDRRKDQTSHIPRLVEVDDLQGAAAKDVEQLVLGLATIDQMANPAERLAATQRLARSLGKSGAEMAQLLQAIEEGRDAGRRISLRELLKQERKIRPAVQGLLSRGCLTVVASEGGLAKTSLSYQLMLSMLTGGLFAGKMQAIQGPVVVVQKDETNANANQKLTLMDACKLVPEHLQDRCGFYFDCWHPGMFPELRQWIIDEGAVAVFMDSLGTLFSGAGKSINDAEVAIHLYRLNRLAAELDVAIVLTHHTRKAQQPTGKQETDGAKRKKVKTSDLYGSAYITNSATDVWALTMDGGTEDEPVFALDILKARSNITQKGDVFHLQGNVDDLSFGFESFNFSPKAEHLDGSASERVLKALPTDESVALTVEELVGTTNLSARTLKRVLKDLYEGRATTGVDRTAKRVGSTKPHFVYFRRRR